MNVVLNLVKFIFAILLSILGIWILYNIVLGIKTGKLRHSDSSSFVIWKNNPVKYLVIMFVLLILSVICFIPLVLLLFQ